MSWPPPVDAQGRAKSKQEHVEDDQPSIEHPPIRSPENAVDDHADQAEGHEDQADPVPCALVLHAHLSFRFFKYCFLAVSPPLCRVAIVCRSLICGG